MPRTLKLEAADIQLIFTSTLEAIVSLIRTQITEAEQPIDFIVLVGEFGQSKVLINTINERFRSDVKKVITPPYGAQAIVCGGALLGLDPSLIKTRKAKYSYGVEVVKDYDPDSFAGLDENRVYVQGSRFLVKGIYFPFVEVGQEVDIDYKMEKEFEIVSPDQQIMEISIYYSAKKNIKFIDDKLVAQIGKLEVILPDFDPEVKDPKVRVTMHFEAMEVHVEAVDHLGKTIETRLKFTSTY